MPRIGRALCGLWVGFGAAQSAVSDELDPLQLSVSLPPFPTAAANIPTVDPSTLTDTFAPSADSATPECIAELPDSTCYAMPLLGCTKDRNAECSATSVFSAWKKGTCICPAGTCGKVDTSLTSKKTIFLATDPPASLWVCAAPAAATATSLANWSTSPSALRLYTDGTIGDGRAAQSSPSPAAGSAGVGAASAGACGLLLAAGVGLGIRWRRQPRGRRLPQDDAACAEFAPASAGEE
mmetsp:Transcript_103186/g.220703  ORF Transcript_103186/g.220703 Transcript_103186/m.220703 type:complete len:238 (-) Transcript_103186:65-778(-)